MSTLTLQLNDSLFARLLAASQARNVAPAELARETLDRNLAAAPAASDDDSPSAYDLLKDGFGCVDSGLGDLSTNRKYMEGFGR
ncbi:MAG TPA: hypothetical protein DDZ88_03525 [Verrucomicrobiales bacterium]|nr:hypothetical protein [Verrucomicrobiales bacterium]